MWWPFLLASESLGVDRLVFLCVCVSVSPDTGAGLGPPAVALRLSKCLCRVAHCHFILIFEAGFISIAHTGFGLTVQL